MKRISPDSRRQFNSFLRVFFTMKVRVVGGFPAVGFYWNATSQNQVDGNCRVALMSLTPGVSLSLSVVTGTVYSDTALQTSFTVFRFTSFV